MTDYILLELEFIKISKVCAAERAIKSAKLAVIMHLQRP